MLRNVAEWLAQYIFKKKERKRNIKADKKEKQEKEKTQN